MKLIKQIVKPYVPRWVMQERQRRSWHQSARAAGVRLVTRDLFFDLERDDKILRIRSAHAVYIPHMIANFDFYTNSVVPVPVEGKMLVDMSGPRYHRLLGFAEMPFLFPSHTEPYGTTADYLKFANLGEGQIVLDIGAYSGVTSIIFAGLVGRSGRVLALEADRMNYECAVQNVELAKRWMGLYNITLIHKAIWSHNDGVMFSHEGAMGSSAVTITGGGRGSESKTPSLTLEALCEGYCLDRVDFIKIDIEGAEVEVLESSRDILARMGARLIVEPHEVDGVLTTARCCAALDRAGYVTRLTEQTGVFAPLIEALPRR